MLQAHLLGGRDDTGGWGQHGFGNAEGAALTLAALHASPPHTLEFHGRETATPHSTLQTRAHQRGIAHPAPGIDKTGFIENGDGANIHTAPAEIAGSRLVSPAPLPPATLVFVTGTYPQKPEWLYVTARTQSGLVRGYVQGLRVTTTLPEPTARLHQVKHGETLKPIADQIFHQQVRPGHDLRFYEEAVLYINQVAGRAGVQRTDVGIELFADHRIWLVSPAYANTLRGVVPGGSITGGAWAEAQTKFKQVGHHLQDILASIEESPHHFKKVAGEYAVAIEAHLPEILGVVAAFIAAEELSVVLAATPTGVGQIIAALIQLVLAALGTEGAIEAGAGAVKSGEQWLTTAWQANGNSKKIGEASESFIEMLVQIALAALAVMGAKGNFGKSLKLVDGIHITPPRLGYAVATGAHGGRVAVPHFAPGSITADAVKLGGPSYMTAAGAGVPTSIPPTGGAPMRSRRQAKAPSRRNWRTKT